MSEHPLHWVLVPTTSAFEFGARHAHREGAKAHRVAERESHRAMSDKAASAFEFRARRAHREGAKARRVAEHESHRATLDKAAKDIHALILAK